MDNKIKDNILEAMAHFATFLQQNMFKDREIEKRLIWRCGKIVDCDRHWILCEGELTDIPETSYER